MMAEIDTGSCASLSDQGLEQISNLTILFPAIYVSAVAKTMLSCQPSPVIRYHYLWAKEAAYTLALNMHLCFFSVALHSTCNGDESERSLWLVAQGGFSELVRYSALLHSSWVAEHQPHSSLAS